MDLPQSLLERRNPAQGLSCSLPNISIGQLSDEGSSRDRPFIIGVAGGTASGKTSVCEVIVRELGIDQSRVAIISQDCFYKTLSTETIKNVKQYNFDHPGDGTERRAALTGDRLFRLGTHVTDSSRPPRRKGGQGILRHIAGLKIHRMFQIPIYDYVSHSRLSESTNMYGIDVILFEGILVFYQQSIMDYMHMRIFVDTDADIRLARRSGSPRSCSSTRPWGLPELPG